jgi:hypothetical protein
MMLSSEGMSHLNICKEIDNLVAMGTVLTIPDKNANKSHIRN